MQTPNKPHISKLYKINYDKIKDRAAKSDFFIQRRN